jgi:hypothetical protein
MRRLGALLIVLVAGCPDGTTTPLDRGVDQYVPVAGDIAPRIDGQGAKVDSAAKVDKAVSCQKPVCCKVGGNEGWCEGCTTTMLNLPGTSSPYYDSCSTCSAVCRVAPAEGWYSSCSNQLIKIGTCS